LSIRVLQNAGRFLSKSGERKMDIGLFSNFTSFTVGAGGTIAQSSGFSSTGQGAALYVSDSLATAALAAAFPEACKASADNVYFRLLGTEDGFITPEELGCPIYAPGTNTQPLIQKAVSYCKAVGLKGVKFPQNKYELWVPARTSAFVDYAANDGHYIVVDLWACSLISTHPRGTTFDCKGPTGGSALTDYVVLNEPLHYGGDVIWRGAAVKLSGTVNSPGYPNPGDDALSHLYMKGIRFFTGITAALNPAWPCWPPSRGAGRENAWDTSMKGVYCQNDKYVGNITLIDCTIDGFLGENIYCGGGLTSNQRLLVRNFTSKNTNGSCFNPNGPRSTDVDGAYCENAVGVMEGWLGWEYGRFVNVHAKGCGGGGEIKGGYEYNGSLRPDGTMPRAEVDVLFESCGRTYLGNFIHGRVFLIDGFAELRQQSPTMVVENMNIDLVVMAHKASINSAVRVLGDETAANANLRNNTIRLDLRRSKEAQTSGFQVNAALEQKFLVGVNNYIYARGQCASLSGGITSFSGTYVSLVDVGLDRSNTSASAVPFDPTVTSSPDFGAHALRGATFSGAAGVYTVNLPPVTSFNEGDELSLDHIDGTKTAHFMEVRDAGVTYPKALVGFKDRARFRCNRVSGRWDLIQTPYARRVTASVDITSTALGAESGPYTITAPGCRAYHSIEVRPPALVTGFIVSAVRAETDQIKFWVRNIDGANPADPAAQTFTANFWVESQ
jgi:hypothetical protein